MSSAMLNNDQVQRLNVFTHYDLDVLADHFAEKIKQRKNSTDLFSPEYLVVQTSGMKRWLALECAKRNSIVAQVTAMMPRQFIMRLAFLMLNVREKSSTLDREILPWALYRIIAEDLKNNVKELDELKGYLGGENVEMKLFSLSDKIADVLDQYMLYRSDWLQQWASGKRLFPEQSAEIWQQYLWQRLTSELGRSDAEDPSAMVRSLIKKLQHLSEEEKERLPQRVSLFGMSLLPPLYLEVFKTLGQVTDVSLYLEVPTMFFIGDTLTDRQIQWREQHDARFRELGLKNIFTENRLLRNLGSTAKEFMNLLLQGDEPKELFEYSELIDNENISDSLLKRTRTDIILCTESASEPVQITEKNWSIRFAKCHDALREVEVLYDLLLECFARDKSLTPSDVLIVTPDIARYAPYVQMVFGDAEERSGAHLPFTIADQSFIKEDTAARFVKDVLEMVSGRFESSVMIASFERSCELSGNPLSDNERDQLARWCEKSGIRWGYDKHHKKNLELPESEAFTFRHGIDRLIAGFVMDDEERLSSGIFPAIGAEGTGAVLLGRFAEFVDSMATLSSSAKELMTIDEWNGTIASMIRTMFVVRNGEEEEDTAYSLIGRALSTLRERAHISGLALQKIPFQVYVSGMNDLLEDSDGSKGFYNGAVTVAGMVPMRSIPFRIVAMLGMNRGTFPRQLQRPLFDLMTQEKKREGDRNVLQGDRYLFLETILSSKDALIITWTGYDGSTGDEKPPSVLVSEFIDHLDREYSFEGGKKAGAHATVKYPLQPFSPRYRSSHPDDMNVITWNTSWFEKRKDLAKRSSIFSWHNSNVKKRIGDSIDGNMLVKVLSDPMKAFLESCRIDMSTYEQNINDEEPFAVDNLGEWRLREAIGMEIFFNDRNAIERLKADGIIPAGVPGNIAVESERRQFQSRIDMVHSIDPTPIFTTFKVRTEIGQVQYKMDIENVSINNTPAKGKKSDAILIEYGNINAKRKLRLWLSHLYLNLLGEVRTTLVALDDTIRLVPLTPAKARTYIDEMQKIVEQNAEVLIPLFPDVSMTFAEEEADIGKARKKAWEKLEALFGRVFNQEYKLNVWVRDAFDDAESWDAAMTKIPGGEARFVEVLHTVFSPMAQYRAGDE